MTAIPTQTLPVSSFHNTSPKKRPSPKNRKKSDIYSTQKAECQAALDYDSHVIQDHEEPDFENCNTDNGESVMNIVNQLYKEFDCNREFMDSATQVTIADIEIIFITLINSPNRNTYISTFRKNY
ncbi:unnamed protein product [Macrosiphum euphorbiae]|uniref:Uncharacterized protein n=1 Tax=Macrosiphum euphorbiae TaxID=13131 RepID=A0AAV0WMH3_9HEMI|nr:unnamed protein product [Macrosiphum euphorbiae]